ncbi:MAG TPA: hypothetical protein VF018_16460 [Acidobacteriaceae bacterium]
MKPTLFLRIASALTLIHAVMHTIGGVFGKPMPGVATMVATTMQANRFPVFGVTRSYADFYFGMGLGMTISLTVETVLLWQLGTLARKDAARLRPIMAVLMLGYLAFAVNSYLYFFLGPVIAELLIALCLGFAIITAKPASAFSTSAVPAHP